MNTTASGAFLVQRGLLAQDTLDAAHDEAERTDKSLGQILLDRMLVDEAELMAALADELGMDIADALALRRPA
jgi:hypothetical protein